MVGLTATDDDVSIGDGPEVRGPVLSLLLAVSGRRVALADLDGPGVDAVAGATRPSASTQPRARG